LGTAGEHEINCPFADSCFAEIFALHEYAQLAYCDELIEAMLPLPAKTGQQKSLCLLSNAANAIQVLPFINMNSRKC
jgi:hypothetical protein